MSTVLDIRELTAKGAEAENESVSPCQGAAHRAGPQQPSLALQREAAPELEKARPGSLPEAAPPANALVFAGKAKVRLLTPRARR